MPGASRPAHPAKQSEYAGVKNGRQEENGFPLLGTAGGRETTPVSTGSSPLGNVQSSAGKTVSASPERLSPEIRQPSSQGFKDFTNPPPGAELQTRNERDVEGGPRKSDDAFADYVVSKGQETPLTDLQTNNARWGIVQSVVRSRDYLADLHTTNMIGNTLMDAMNRSPTFQNMVSYGLNHGGRQLKDLYFSNMYERNPLYNGAPVSFAEMGDYLRQHPQDTMPIFARPVRRPQPQLGSGWSNVNIGIAPGANSESPPVWRDELIHELEHHLTAAEDSTVEERRTHVGPTELLSQRVMHELGYPVRLPSSYGPLGRNGPVFANDRAALRDAQARNGEHEQAFFQRLETIRQFREASRDFHELEAAPPVPGMAPITIRMSFPFAAAGGA